MREGYTVVTVGWEFDIPKKQGLVLLKPIPTDNGKPITGWIDPGPCSSQQDGRFVQLCVWRFHASVSPLDPKNSAYRLTERDGLFPFRVWFRAKNGSLARSRMAKSSPTSIGDREGRLQPGMVYQLAMSPASTSRGRGFAAVRDLASAVKYNSDAIVRGKYVYTFARPKSPVQRQMVTRASRLMNRAASDRRALYPDRGTGLGSFNERWAQPMSWVVHTTKFRFATNVTDPVTARETASARVFQQARAQDPGSGH